MSTKMSHSKADKHRQKQFAVSRAWTTTIFNEMCDGSLRWRIMWALMILFKRKMEVK